MFKRLATPVVVVSLVVGLAPARVDAEAVAYVGNHFHSRVSVIDLGTHAVTADVPVGSVPFGIAITPSGEHVWVANHNDGTVSTIRTDTNVEIPPRVPVGAFARQVAITPDGAFVYVTDPTSRQVVVIDTTTRSVVRIIPFWADLRPIGVVVTLDGRWAYVANQTDTNLGHGSVKVIDTSKILTPEPALLPVTIEVGRTPVGIAITADGTSVFVANADDDTISVIATGTNTVTCTASVGDPVIRPRVYPQGLAIHPNGRYVYVANYYSPVRDGNSSVSVIDGQVPCAGEMRRIPVPGEGTAYLAAHPDGSRLYASVHDANVIRIIDIDALSGSHVLHPRSISIPGPMPIVIKPGLSANAGPDQTKNEGDAVTLDGSRSTGGSLTFSWSQVGGPTVVLTDPTSPTPRFTAPLLAGGFGSQTLTFQLAVTSGAESVADTVNVTVVNVNHAPVADAGDSRAVNEGSTVTLDGQRSFDSDGDEPLLYSWLQQSGTPVTLSGAGTATPSFVAPVLPGGISGTEILCFQLTVSDAAPGLGGLSSTDDVCMTVEQVNHRPMANAGGDQTRNEGSLVALNGSGSNDPDGDAITHLWTQASGPPVALSDATSPTPTFTAPITGPGGATLAFELLVSDGRLTSAPDQVVVTVANVNDPPRCDLAQARPGLLWPPSHKLVPVTILNVTDPDNDLVAITITDVTQDEPVNGLGDGDTSPDAVIQSSSVLLRAERSGTSNGRVYQVRFSARDNQVTGGSCTGSLTVRVPHSMKGGGTAIDDGQNYTSTLP